MTTPVQQTAAKQNAKKTQTVWQGMSFRQQSLSLPEAHKRTEPGAKGEGDYYRIVVRPKEQFTSFRTQDIGGRGRLQRLAGRRNGGSWATQAWLVNKIAAHVEDKRLVADSKDIADLIRQLGSQPILEKGDIFTAKDRPSIAEKDSSTSVDAQEVTDKKARASKRVKQRDYPIIL